MGFHIFSTQIGWRNIIDILFVAFLIYQVIAMLKGTRAAQVVIGMLVIFIAYAVSSILQFETLYWIISRFYSSFIIVVIVLFQDDIRRLLTQFGRSPFDYGLDETSGMRVIDEVVTAAENLSHEKLGGIVVFERAIGLDKLHDHSVRIDALVSDQLLMSIFNSFSPLHDGAVIIQKNRISCAAAHLPLSKKTNAGKKLGTRHSAAVGISEETDAVVVVISEETGSVSIAVNGELYRQPSGDAAKRRLQMLLLTQPKHNPMRHILENYIFASFNWLTLLTRRAFPNRYKYAGPERRRKAERRHTITNQVDADTQGEDHFRIEIEKENRSAARGKTMINLSLPTFLRNRLQEPAKVNLVLNTSGTRSSKERTLPATQMELPALEEVVVNRRETPSAIQQNEAAKAISQLGPDDRLVPPVRPAPPPRDVLIAGVSLNPPLDELAPQRHEKSKNDLTPDKESHLRAGEDSK